MRRRRECLPVKPRPKTHLDVRVFSVIRRPAEGVEFSGFQGADEDLFLDRNAGVDKAASCPSGKAVG